MTASNESKMSTPSKLERDGDGRLVGVIIDGAPSSQVEDGNAWLVAVDGSSHAEHAVAEAAGLAGLLPGCRLHLVNVQHWLSKEAAEAELARRGWAASEKARALLGAKGVSWRLHVLMGDAAERIVSLASQLGCRGIVIGSRGLGAAETLLVGSVAYKVIHLSPVSVLVVR